MTSATPIIRLATAADIAGVLEISNWAAAHTAANFAIEPESLEAWSRDFAETSAQWPWFVADADADAGDREAILGFAKSGPWKGRCAYTYSAEITVYVHPDHHRRGIACALYEALLGTMTAQGFQTAIGGITLPNDASVGLHESFGMKRCALFERVGWKFGRWHDVGYWQAILQGDGEPPARLRRVDEVQLPTGSPPFGGRGYSY